MKNEKGKNAWLKYEGEKIKKVLISQKDIKTIYLYAKQKENVSLKQ